MNRNYKIEFIIDTIDDLTKQNKLEIAKLIWDDKHLRKKMKEKGCGIEINTKYMNDSMIDKLFNLIKKLDCVDECLI